MKVSRLELFGFKSFMEKLVLPLGGGITGVVGPNGCGKSNIVDAIRWILGETRARNLRGGTLEDVIFNGTDKLRPLGLAEVSIVLRADDSNFFSDLRSETLEADAIAEEATQNDSPAELEATSSASSESVEDESRPKLSVVQGGLSEEGGTVPEAAPSVDSQTDVPETPSRNVSATLIDRFAWLKSVNEVQLTRRYYRSGESEYFINRVPCRLSDMKEFFRAVGLGARAYTIVAQGEVSRIVTARPEEIRLILEEAAGVAGFRDRIVAANRRLEETRANIARVDDIIKEVTRQVNSLKRQAARAIARKQLKEDLGNLDRELSIDGYRDLAQRQKSAHEARRRAQEAEQQQAASVERATSEEQASRNELMTVDVESDAIRREIDSLRQTLNERARARADQQAKINELKAFASGRAAELKRLEERSTTLADRLVECESRVRELSQQDQSLTARLGEVDVAATQEELLAISETLTELRQKLRTKEQEVRTVRDQLIATQSRLKSSQDQLIAASPMHQLSKSLSGEARTLVSQVVGNAQLFVDGISVPAPYARAVQSVLGERAQFLVADEYQKIATTFVERALGGDGTNRRGLGLGVYRRSSDAAAREEIPLVEGERWLLDLVTVSSGFETGASLSLGNVVLVDSVSRAFGFFERIKDLPSASRYLAVTTDGDMVTSGSFYSLRHEGGLVQLKNQITELTSKVASLEEQQRVLSGEREQILTTIQGAEERHREVLRESQRRQVLQRDLSNQQGNVRGRLHAEQRLIEQQKGDVSRIAEQIKEANTRILAYQEEEKRAQEVFASLVKDDESGMKQRLSELEASGRVIESKRSSLRSTLGEASQRLFLARQASEKARQGVSECELSLQKLSLERANTLSRIEEIFGAEGAAELVAFAESAIESRLESQVRAAKVAEAQRIRERIQREGDVDPESIVQLEIESKRLEDLTLQRNDLEKGAGALNRTIDMLNETSVKRFLETFEAVNANFSRLIPRLFGGGKGELELIEPTKPLETGVRIVVRPPGKKVNSLELLSGGEKALSAISLIFAMFLVRPSPLCVLDEVDAPLDEANLHRYISLVKEMSQRTQFLMVTHNKQSMASSDTLVGVTMQEPGSSKVISVSLDEAYRQVA